MYVNLMCVMKFFVCMVLAHSFVVSLIAFVGFSIGPCPHDWLLPQTCAVIHHGGAGTTAAGLRYGLPTLVCPFFGDQPFWGAMVEKAGGELSDYKPGEKVNYLRFAFLTATYIVIVAYSGPQTMPDR